MKNILVKIEFHYTYLIMALGLVLTGHFINLFIFTSLIIIHELGHATSAKIFRYKINKIVIYPYGGITKLDTLVNTKIGVDVIVTISGIVIQSIYFYFIYILYQNGIVREYVYNLFYLYHKSMLFFNILPIIPLDGSKIVNLLLSKYFNFNLANTLTVYISLISLIFFLIFSGYERNYSLLMTIFVLLENILKFYKNIKYLYSRFILERYLYDFNYSKVKLIKDKNKMHKNKKHFFIGNNRFVPEKEYLKDVFKNKYN